MNVRRTILVIVNMILLLILALRLTSVAENERPHVEIPTHEIDVARAKAAPRKIAEASSGHRSLFRQRNFVAAKAAPPVAPAEERPLFRVVGILHGDEEQMAIIAPSDGHGIRRLRVGQEHAGWRLVELTARMATFRHDEQVAQLTLTAAK
jgi:hypothetical protein